MASTPEESMHTSVKLHCSHLKDYLSLVDWSGKIIREGKRGSVNQTLPPILDRLDIEPETWLILVTKFESRFKSLVGAKEVLKAAAQKLGFKRTPGLADCLALLH